MRTLIHKNRDLRIDFFRGLALWCMFIDHLIRSSLRAITIRQFGFSDGAELFVLLSGLSAGIVYQRIMVRDGLPSAWLKIARRIATIYRTHLIMFVVFVAEAGILVAWLNPPGFLGFTFTEFLHLDRFSVEPFRSVWQAVLLGNQPKFLDVLPLYIVLMFLLGIVLPLIRWPRLLLAGSFLLYVAARVFDLGLGGWTEWFNPLAWQLIFMIGVTAPYILKARNHSRVWDWLAALFAIFSLFESHAQFLSRHISSAYLINFYVDKPMVHPFRLMAIVSLAWLAWRCVPATAHWLRSRWAEPLILLGQHSLRVYASSVLIAVVGQAILFARQEWISQILVQGLGTLALIAVAGVSAWINNKSHPAGRGVSARELRHESELVGV